MTEEEWTQFHQKFNDQWKDEEDKTKENMSNRCDPEEEEAMGENHHREGNSLPEGTVATLHFPIQQPEGIAPMKNISPSMFPRFHGKAAEDPDEFFLNLASSVTAMTIPPMHRS